MRFQDFPGAEEDKQNLIDLIKSGKISHAHLFHSPEGGVALPMALGFASILNCENPSEEGSCGECPSCRKMETLTHPDLHFSFPLTTTKDVKKTEDLKCQDFLVPWRQFIIENPFGTYQGWTEKFSEYEKLPTLKNMEIVKREAKEIIQSQALSAFEGKYKIFIIWSSEHLNIPTANTLLKIVEEPTPKTVFIFVTSHLGSHLKTLLSRVQIHSFPALKSEEVEQVLQSRFEIDKDTAAKAGMVSGGSVTEALHISGSPNRVDFEKVQEWLRDCYSMDLKKLLKSAEEFSNSNGNYQRGVFKVALRVLENSVGSLKENSNGIWNDRLNEFFRDFYENVGPSKFESIREELEDGLYLLDRNIQARLLFLQKSIKLNQILKG